MTFWDYDDKKWFANPASMTAIAWVGTDQKQFIIDKSDQPNFLAQNGPKLSKFGKCFRGFEPGKIWIWKDAAKRSVNGPLLRKLYPDNTKVRHFLMPRAAEMIVFVKPGTEPPQSFIDSLT